jgi:O-antigen/teichoic acid export membrane protein
MVAFRFLSRGLGVISTLVLARLLNITDFAIVAIAFTVSAALNSVSNVGVTENLVRYKTVGRPELDTGFTVQLFKGVITCVLLIFLAPTAANWFSEPRLTNVIYVLAAVFALSGIENIGIVNFRRDMRFDREFQLSMVERSLAFAVTLISAVLLRSYWALVIGLLVAKLVRVIATYVMEPYRPSLGLHSWKELVGFSMWMWLSSLVYIVWTRADPLVVGSQITKVALGLYVVALDIALLPTTEIMEPIGAVLFARFAAEFNAEDKLRTNAFELAVSLMVVMAPIALIISASSTDLVGILLGSKWSAAAPIVAILAFSAVLSPFSNTAAQSLTARGKVRSNLAVVLCASFIKVCLLYVAARTGNLYIIAISALAITSAESSLFIYMLMRNGSRFDGLAWPTLRSIGALLIAALVLNSTGLAWAGDQAPPFLTCVWHGILLSTVGGGVYTTVLATFWCIAGRPYGPERQILAVILPLLARVYQGRATLLRKNSTLPNV